MVSLPVCNIRIDNNGDCNTHGQVSINGVRRLINGRYQARLHNSSKNKPLMWSDDYKTMDGNYWFGFSRTAYGSSRNKHLPKVNKGETLMFRSGAWHKR